MKGTIVKATFIPAPKGGLCPFGAPATREKVVITDWTADDPPHPAHEVCDKVIENLSSLVKELMEERAKLLKGMAPADCHFHKWEDIDAGRYRRCMICGETLTLGSMPDLPELRAGTHALVNAQTGEEVKMDMHCFEVIKTHHRSCALRNMGEECTC